MATAQDIEGYLIQMGVPYEEIAEHTWMIHDEYETIDNIVVRFNDPVVLFRVKLMDVPDGATQKDTQKELFEMLLRLNATDMIHGAYGLEGSSVVATDTLQAENLDFNEFQASVDALSMCITDHYRKLSRFHQAPAKAS